MLSKNRYSGRKKKAFRPDQEREIYNDFMISYHEIEDHIKYIEGDFIPSELGKSHPSVKYVFIRSQWDENKAFKLLSQSVEFKLFIKYGQVLSKFLLEHKSIPKNKVKKVQKAVEVFLKMRRVPNKVGSWWLRNKPKFQVFIESQKWPLKEENTEEKYKIGPFTVHNTLGLTDEDLEKTNASIATAQKFLSKSKIPKAKQVLYGEVFIVGKLLHQRTMAWYNVKEDRIFLRPLLKFGFGEAHNLIHEIGHRYWRKIMSPMDKKEWSQYHYQLGTSKPTIGISPEKEKIIDTIRNLKVGDKFPIKVQGLIRGGPPYITNIKKTPMGDLKFTLETKKGKRGGVSLSGIVSHYKSQETKQKKMEGYPTLYSATSPEEHFCESFAMYAMGSLKEPFMAKFEQILG